LNSLTFNFEAALLQFASVHRVVHRCRESLAQCCREMVVHLRGSSANFVKLMRIKAIKMAGYAFIATHHPRADSTAIILSSFA